MLETAKATPSARTGQIRPRLTVDELPTLDIQNHFKHPGSNPCCLRKRGPGKRRRTCALVLGEFVETQI